MKKLKAAWKKFNTTDLADNLKTYLGIFVVFSIIFFPLMHGLSYIDFLAPITEPIAKIGFYLLAFGIGIYFLIVGGLIVILLLEGIKDLPYTLSNFVSSQEKIRAAVGWVVGIFISVALMAGLFMIFDTLNIDVASDSEEESNIYGPWGAAFIFSLMIGTRCGMAVYERNIRGGITDEGEIQFKAWLIGIVIFGFLTSILDLVFGYDSEMPWLIQILNFAVIGVLFAILKPWHDIKIRGLSNRLRDGSTDESLTSRISTNLILLAVLAVILSLFGAYAWLGFSIHDYVHNEFDNAFLAGFALVAYVMLALIGLPLAWGIVSRWLERK